MPNNSQLACFALPYIPPSIPVGPADAKLHKEDEPTMPSTDDHGSNQIPDPIVPLVLRCQQGYAAWVEAVEAGQREELGTQYRQSLEELYEMLADDLRKSARAWVRKTGYDVEALALNQFGGIVFALPKLDIDPKRNVRNLLLLIGRRGLIDDYRRTISTGPRRRSNQIDQDRAPEPGAPEARMWRAPGEQASQVTSLDALPDLADTRGASVEERTARQLDNRSILDAAWEFWHHTYAGIDLQIMMLRYEIEPPRSFSEVAEQLGTGWIEATVRQRHKRMLDATRKYLRERGLIDDAAAS